MSRPRKPKTLEEAESDRRAFDRAKAVLDGVIPVPGDERVPKMLSLLLDADVRMRPDGVDGRITAEGFFVRYRPGERESEYFLDVAAPTLKEILRQASIERVRDLGDAGICPHCARSFRFEQ